MLEQLMVDQMNDGIDDGSIVGIIDGSDDVGIGDGSDE